MTSAPWRVYLVAGPNCGGAIVATVGILVGQA